MNYTKKITLSAFAVFLMAFGGTANADNLLSFSVDGGNTLGDSFVVDNGSTATVSVFLSETAPDTALANDGLFGFGLRGSLTSGAGRITAGDIDPVFDFPDTDEFSDSGIDWLGSVFLNDVPVGTNILLGQFQYQVTGEGTSTFQFTDFDPGSGTENANWLTGAGVELDESIFGAGSANSFQLSLSTTAIPEPSSMVVLTLASSFLVVRRRRTIANRIAA